MRAGDRFGGFVLERPLGRGGFATVWAARHVRGEPVAVKIGHASIEGASIQREAERIASFDHPGIVYVYDAGTQDGRSWMALERASGTLAELESPLPVIDLAEHLLQALGHLHARGIVHRDLKPSNVLIGCAPHHGRSRSDRAGIRIADFGIAWGAGAAAGELSSGTAGWMAPEQAAGVVHPSADVYALASILRALVDQEGRSDLAPWIRRATAEAPADRFPTVAHALAALPGSRGRTLVALDPTGPSPAVELETVTRPVVLQIPPVVARQGPLAAVVPPVVPAAPPIPARRVPRAELLDAGMSLLAFRPLGTAGRTELMLSLWSRIEQGPIVLCGRPEDTSEVAEQLSSWARETGGSADVRVTDGDTPEATLVPRLSPWSLAERAQGLGFDLDSAMRLSAACSTAAELRAVIVEAVRGDLVDAGEAGLTLRGWLEHSPPAQADPEQALDAAWWNGDTFGIARTLPVYVARTPAGWRRDAVEALARTRIDKPRDPASAEALEVHAQRARSEHDSELADQLAIETAGIWVRARRPVEARRVLGRVEAPVDRLVGWLALHRAFVCVMERDPTAEEHLQRAMSGSGGRFRALAFATLADVHLQHGRTDEALEAALRGVACIDPSHAAEALSVHSALILAHMHREEVDEEAIRAQIEAASAYLPRAANRAAVGRFALFRAQQAMRLQDWDRADRLLYEAQTLHLRCGGSATFVVLNHGLVGLHRGDLASIGAITPASWDAERAVAAPYVRPLMDLHALFVALGQDHDSLDGWFEPLERGEPLPALTHEGIRLAAALAPAHAARLLALTQPG